MKSQAWKKYTFEFLSIFFAIIAAFALDQWNNDRKESLAEEKILKEILNGLKQDKLDVKDNVGGHQLGIDACQYWREVLDGKAPNLDSLAAFYHVLTRDFISIQNISGYETLKSRGFELIKNDSLRTKIISLYEYDYQTLLKLEEEYSELQFQDNYFTVLNGAIAPHLQFSDTGELEGISTPLKIDQGERSLLFSYLWKIQFNRKFILNTYQTADLHIDELIEMINEELDR